MTKYIKKFLIGILILTGVLLINNTSLATILPTAAISVNQAGVVVNTNSSIVFTSTVAASKFIGDGSLLTNLATIAATWTNVGGTNVSISPISAPNLLSANAFQASSTTLSNVTSQVSTPLNLGGGTNLPATSIVGTVAQATVAITVNSLAGSTNSNDLFLTTTTNIFGGTNNTDYYTTNSALNFTLTGTTAIPVTYEVRGYVEYGAFSNNTLLVGNDISGLVVKLTLLGTDKYKGFNLVPSGFGGNSQFNPLFNSSYNGNKPFLSQINAGQTVPSTAYFDVLMTTAQTNAYLWDVFNVNANALVTPCITSNTWLEVRKISPTF